MPAEGHENAVINEKYLPYSREQLRRHFAPVSGGGLTDRWLTYYLASAANYQAFAEEEALAALPTTNFTSIRRGRQMEKDERFWVVATLMAFFEQPEPQRIVDFSALLSSCLGPNPPFAGSSSWEEALGSRPELFFEANLASPPAYRNDLQEHPGEHMLDIPFIHEAAGSRGARLEGPTKVDALLIAPDTGFTVLFEAKVLSDTSCQIEFDVRRNQIARNIDVMLESPSARVIPPMNSRDPAKSCFVLLTPDLFRRNPDSRLYGWLMGEYQKDAALLHRHLPHREPDELVSIPSRLGWLTWEDCNVIHPGSCRWLPLQGESHA